MIKIEKKKIKTTRKITVNVPGLGGEMVDTKPVAENAVRSSRGNQTTEQDHLQENGRSDWIKKKTI